MHLQGIEYQNKNVLFFKKQGDIGFDDFKYSLHISYSTSNKELMLQKRLIYPP